MKPESHSIEARIKQFIVSNMLFNAAGFPHSDSASFLQEGVVDSVGVMELVEFVQASFGIEVAPEEILPDNFDSVRQLADYVRRKGGGTTISMPASAQVLAGADAIAR